MKMKEQEGARAKIVRDNLSSFKNCSWCTCRDRARSRHEQVWWSTRIREWSGTVIALHVWRMTTTLMLVVDRCNQFCRFLVVKNKKIKICRFLTGTCAYDRRWGVFGVGCLDYLVQTMRTAAWKGDRKRRYRSKIATPRIWKQSEKPCERQN